MCLFEVSVCVEISFFEGILELFRQCYNIVFQFILYLSNKRKKKLHNKLVNLCEISISPLKLDLFLFYVYMLSFLYHLQDIYWACQNEQQGGYRVGNRNWLSVANTWIHLRFYGGSVLLFFLVICVFFCPVTCMPCVASVSWFSIITIIFKQSII